MSREQERTKRKSLKGINLSCIFKGIGLKFLFFMCGFRFLCYKYISYYNIMITKKKPALNSAGSSPMFFYFT